MNYVTHLNIGGVEAKEIPCITGAGAPTTATEGAVGCFYMDTTNGKVYKCTAANAGVYTWADVDGENYVLTEADKDEIADAVAVKMPMVKTAEQPIFVSSVEEMTDTSKSYVLMDTESPYHGQIYTFSAQEVKGYTNLIPASVNTDGSIYNGKGYSTGYLSGGAVTANSNRCVTGFMPIGCGSATTARGEQVICFENINVPEGDKYVRVGYYTEDKTYIIQQSGPSFKATDDGQASSIYTAEAGMIKTVDVTGYTAYLQKTMGKTPAFFRVSVPGATGITDSSIITVNEEITEGGGGVTYKWAPTGHAYLPVDYEPRIIEAEKAIGENAEAIDDLKATTKQLDTKIADARASGNAIPEGVRNAVSTLVKKVMSREGSRLLRFLISSDAHHDNNNELSTKGTTELGQAQAEVLNLMGVDFVANLGDVAWGAETNTVDEVVEQIMAYKRLTASALKGERQLWCEGNHDDGNYSLNTYPDTPKLTASAINTLLYSENSDVVYDHSHAVEGYCYKDFEHLKVRVICLNSNQETTGDGGVMQGHQLKWFAETALNMTGKTDWNVITMAHHPTDYGMPTLFKDCTNILDAFVNKKKLVNNNSAYYTTVDGTVINADYTDTSCQYVAHFHGHTHAFCILPIEKYTGTDYVEIGAYEIGIPNACYSRNNQNLGSSNARIARFSTATTYNKTDADGMRTSFNLVTVCLDTKTIYADNYGAGIDRVLSY